MTRAAQDPRSDIAGGARLERSAKVEVGDHVVTSGLGGRFPKGVWIGQVSGLTSGGDLFQSVEVTPRSALGRLEEVMVVTGTSGGGP